MPSRRSAVQRTIVTRPPVFTSCSPPFNYRRRPTPAVRLPPSLNAGVPPSPSHSIIGHLRHSVLHFSLVGQQGGIFAITRCCLCLLRYFAPLSACPSLVCHSLRFAVRLPAPAACRCALISDAHHAMRHVLRHVPIIRDIEVSRRLQTAAAGDES